MPLSNPTQIRGRDSNPVAGRSKVDDRELAAREYASPDLESQRSGLGRQIFAPLRQDLMGAEEGASSLFTYVNKICNVAVPPEK